MCLPPLRVLLEQLPRRRRRDERASCFGEVVRPVPQRRRVEVEVPNVDQKVDDAACLLERRAAGERRQPRLCEVEDHRGELLLREDDRPFGGRFSGGGTFLHALGARYRSRRRGPIVVDRRLTGRVPGRTSQPPSTRADGASCSRSSIPPSTSSSSSSSPATPRTRKLRCWASSPRCFAPRSPSPLSRCGTPRSRWRRSTRRASCSISSSASGTAPRATSRCRPVSSKRFAIACSPTGPARSAKSSALASRTPRSDRRSPSRS